MKRMMTAIILGIFSVLLVQNTAAYPQISKDSVTTVPSVDLKRYSGKWFEIAKLPNRFQKQCVGNTTAEYVIKSSEELEVINSCLEKDGKVDVAKGKAKIKDKQSNAKLEVRFAPAFLSFIPQVWGDYWVIDLDQNYQYAVVGNPDRKYLWILSRTPQMDDATYQNVLRKLEKMGYDPNKLVKTPQKVESLKGTVVETN